MPQVSVTAVLLDDDGAALLQYSRIEIIVLNDDDAAGLLVSAGAKIVPLIEESKESIENQVSALIEQQNRRRS